MGRGRRGEENEVRGEDRGWEGCKEEEGLDRDAPTTSADPSLASTHPSATNPAARRTKRKRTSPTRIAGTEHEEALDAGACQPTANPRPALAIRIPEFLSPTSAPLSRHPLVPTARSGTNQVSTSPPRHLPPPPASSPSRKSNTAVESLDRSTAQIAPLTIVRPQKRTAHTLAYTT
ncbi:hypothetical protein HETIRDRAFT_451747 [Heterobasidion irregulare TC 32-1]|uniref:Uncharacterized protein n=1 Tax=Heterobasidion irregulare (strain TC 32-1) TaxID=747525 RepID=W4K8S2_HETIT|nr:uncharacterized protein HETIRDRAFT_451747 [Heterobasidion irregulare TC 32-1]ETW82149.1 hypothetical protein HETIRDRAFT_451747 [Heterobasidion irregulare TC 32-1]